jgi:hypothetical protein
VVRIRYGDGNFAGSIARALEVPTWSELKILALVDILHDVLYRTLVIGISIPFLSNSLSPGKCSS